MKTKFIVCGILSAVLALTGCNNSTGGIATGNKELDKALSAVKEYNPLDYVTLGEYKGVEVNTYVSEEEIQEKINEELENNATYEEITDRAVEEGDTVNIDFVGKHNGEEFQGGSYAGFDLEIGSNSFIPGFEDGLVGVKPGETKDLNLTFPEEYKNAPELAGEPVVFNVTVNYIRGKKNEVEFNDEFVTNVTNGEYNTTAEYYDDIKNDLYKSKVSAMADTAFMKVLETSKVSETPQFLVDLMKLRIDASYKSMAKQGNYDNFEQFVTDYYNMDMNTYNAEVEKTAKSYVEQQLITEAIANTEGITISDEEYQDFLNMYMNGNNIESEEEMAKYTVENYASKLDDLIHEAAILEKVLGVIGDNIVEVSDVPETSADGADTGNSDSGAAEKDNDSDDNKDDGAEDDNTDGAGSDKK